MGVSVESMARVGRPAAVDAMLVALITLVSALPYLPRLGFYSDDFGLLIGLSSAGGQSFLAWLAQNFPGRPVQGLYFLGLFSAFGDSPLGYHVVGTCMLAGSAAGLSLLLVRLSIGKARSFATSLLFVMLPQLSTIRVWFAASQIGLSLALMFVSLHSQLSFARSGKKRWLAAAVLAGVLSIGAYEIFAPLIAGFAAALCVAGWRSSKRRIDARAAASAAILLAIVVGAFAYKLVSSGGRVGPIADPGRYLLGLRQLVRADYDWRVDSGLNIFAAARAYFSAPVRGWWSGATDLVTGKAGVAVSVIALLIAVIAVWRLGQGDTGGEEQPRRLLLIGIAALLLGNATFLIVPAIAFTSTGLDNRVQVAAAVGVAMIFAALISWATGLLPAGRRQRAFGAVVGLVSAAAFARVTSIESYWAAAPALQQKVLDAATADLKHVPADSTIILDGVCAYFGPAVVFETSWDVGGALSLALRRPLGGDAVSSRMSVTSRGLQTSIYKEPAFYPYGPQLYVYAPSTHSLVQLKDAGAAKRYFAARKPANCPGFVARGVEV